MSAEWTIRAKLYGAFGALLGLMTATCLVSIWSAAAVRTQQTSVKEATDLLRRASDLKAMNSEIFAAEKNMIIYGMIQDSQSLQRWTDQMSALVKTGTERAGELRGLVTEGQQKQVVDQLKTGMQQWNTRCDACHQVASDLTTNRKEVARLSAEGEQIMLANYAVAEQIRGAQTRLVADETATSDAVARRAYVLSVVPLGLALVVGVLVFLIVRGIGIKLTTMAADLRDTAEHLVGAASELSGSADSLSRASMEQAGALQETAASMEQVSSMTRENGDHSRDAARLTADADTAVQRSNAALTDTERTMASLVTSSNRVSQIISTIDEIAFQTNILALNAAIEAARAGESGAGFAVVADEVRRLAQRCAQAARDTASLIDDSIASCGEANATLGGVVNAMEQVTGNVAAVRGLAEQVSSASTQQSAGIDTVSQALARIEQLTQATAATAEETAATSASLGVQADRSRQLVAQLERMVSGRAAARGLATRAATGGPAFAAAR